jgi:hypothetical protein
MNSSGTSPRDDLQQMVNAYETSRMIHVVATLGIADLLASGPEDVVGLALFIECCAR